MVLVVGVDDVADLCVCDMTLLFNFLLFSYLAILFFLFSSLFSCISQTSRLRPSNSRRHPGRRAVDPEQRPHPALRPAARGHRAPHARQPAAARRAQAPRGIEEHVCQGRGALQRPRGYQHGVLQLEAELNECGLQQVF